MLTAEKIVVSTYDQNDNKKIDKDITNKDIIKKVSLILKNSPQVQEPPNLYGSDKNYLFYNEKLGGKQQIYKLDNYVPKLIFRKLAKEILDSKFETKLLTEDENIWQNGSQVSSSFCFVIRTLKLLVHTMIIVNNIEEGIE